MTSRNRIYSSSKVKQPFKKMHICSNLNKLLPQNRYRCCLIHWSTSIQPEISFTVLYTPWKIGDKHARCMYGGGDSSVVREPDSWLKGRGFESLQERRENFLLQSQLSVLTLFRYPFHPRVTAVARKRPRSFCQKCRWQVTAKHTYTLRMWLCIKWHGAWLYGVHRTRRDGSSFMWHQPCQRCKYTTSVDIQKRAIKSYSLM